MSARSESVERLLADLPGARTGADPRYDERYEALKAEVGKLDSPSGSPVDWATVEASSTFVLESMSKDLLAAAYLGAARLRARGVEGCADGLELLDGLLERFGDEVFPSRGRARANAISWFVEFAAREVAALGATPVDPGAATRARTATQALADRAAARLGDEAPSVANLRDSLGRVVTGDGAAAAPAPTPVEARPPEAAAVPALPAPTAPESPVEPSAPVPHATDAIEPSTPSADATPSVEAAVAEPEPPRRRTVEDVAAEFLEPIPGPSAAGPDAKYDPDYEWIVREMAKVDGVGSRPDYERVLALGSEVLRSKTKDLLIASYVGAAAFELRGLEGVALALALPAALLTRFADELHPVGPRLRRRANALSFLYEQIARRITELPLAHTDAACVFDFETLAKEHFRIVGGAFESDGPATRPLLEAITRVAMSVPEPPAAAPPPPPTPAAAPAPAPAPVASAPAPDAAPTTPAPTASAPAASVALPEAPAALADVADLVPFLAKTGQSLVTTAAALRTVDVADPRAVRLLRIGLYLHLEAPPPHGPDGKTSVPPPPDNLFERLTKMAQHEKWAAILEETEASLGQFRFCLDLHRYSFVALRGLGNAAATTALVGSLRPALERMPAWVNLQFGNGRAFADADTKRFLKNDVLASRAAKGANGGGSNEPAALIEARAAFDEALAGPELELALDAAEALVAAAPDDGSRFRARLHVASSLADAGHTKVARALQQALDDEVRTRGIESWQPDLALTHLEAMATSLREAESAGVALESVVSRIARISPRAALKYSR